MKKLLVALILLAVGAAAQIVNPGGNGGGGGGSSLTPCGPTVGEVQLFASSSALGCDAAFIGDTVNHLFRIGGAPIMPFAGLYVGPDEISLPSFIQGYTQAKNLLLTTNTIGAVNLGIETYGDLGLYMVTSGTGNPYGIESDLYGGEDGNQLVNLNLYQDANGFDLAKFSSILISSLQFTGGGSVIDNIGLEIQDQEGATNNYAFKSGAGMVEVGDATKAAGIHVQGAGAFDVDGTGIPTALWIDLDNNNAPYHLVLTNEAAGKTHFTGMQVDLDGSFEIDVDGANFGLYADATLRQSQMFNSSLQVESWISTLRNTAPADADIAANEMAIWFDPTNGAAHGMLKSKQADGTVQLSSLPSLSDIANPFLLGKTTASAVAPGAGKADLRWVAGTIGGTCKLVANAGTSATEVTIVDGVGGGC